jgi:Kef-type K+ transport system membrane component KefB
VFVTLCVRWQIQIFKVIWFHLLLLIICTSCGLSLIKFISCTHTSHSLKYEKEKKSRVTFSSSYRLSLILLLLSRRRKRNEEGIRVNFKFCHSATSACDRLAHSNRNNVRYILSDIKKSTYLEVVNNKAERSLKYSEINSSTIGEKNFLLIDLRWYTFSIKSISFQIPVNLSFGLLTTFQW